MSADTDNTTHDGSDIGVGEHPPNRELDHADKQRNLLAEAWTRFRELDGPAKVIDGVAPMAGFLIGYQLADAYIGIAAALGVALLVAGYRVIRRDSPKAVVIGVATVALYSLFVVFTGEGRAFYLPPILVGGIVGVLFGASLFTDRPLTLRLCQRIGLAPTTATEDHLALHRRLTVWWLAFSVIRTAAEAPLYLADMVTALGTVVMLEKLTLLALVILTGIVIHRANTRISATQNISAAQNSVTQNS